MNDVLLETKPYAVEWKEVQQTRIDIIKRKAEIESIEDRIVQLCEEEDTHDDMHKARMKLKHVKETLVDLQVTACGHDIQLLRLQLISRLPDV